MNWIEYFKKWASRYEREVENYGYEPWKLLKPFVPLIGKRELCIDVGCGTGKSLEAVSRICSKVIGIEPVEKMAKRAEEKGFKVIRAKGEELSKIKEKVDLVTFFASIDYMNAEKVAEEVKKVLSKNGKVFLTVEPENEGKVVGAFINAGFKIEKRVEKKAYQGQRYICLLFSA